MVFKRKKRYGKGELVAVLVITIIAFGWAASAARIQRGYAAFGGEYMILVFPAVYYLAKKTILDWINDIRGLYAEAEKEDNRGGRP